MNLDPPIKRLVEALNNIPELYTISSCAGHHNPEAGQMPWGKFLVDFSVSYTPDGWEALEEIACCVDEWTEVFEERLELKMWIDGGLRWSLEGEYIAQKDIDVLAEIVEETPAPTPGGE